MKGVSTYALTKPPFTSEFISDKSVHFAMKRMGGKLTHATNTITDQLYLKCFQLLNSNILSLYTTVLCNYTLKQWQFAGSEYKDFISE